MNENSAKDSDEVSMENGSINSDVTITTSVPKSIQSGSPFPPNLNSHQTNLQITQPNNAASSTTNNVVDTSSVIAARDKTLISQAMAKVTKSMFSDRMAYVTLDSRIAKHYERAVKMLLLRSDFRICREIQNL